ncbi:hypothetical protein C8F01DRAFT_1117364 [Mycena amicta]|nr:hypothetical protein C8F01DRAFT_1117364 [Mycena amicta]
MCTKEERVEIEDLFAKIDFNVHKNLQPLKNVIDFLEDPPKKHKEPAANTIEPFRLDMLGEESLSLLTLSVDPESWTLRMSMLCGAFSRPRVRKVLEHTVPIIEDLECGDFAAAGEYDLLQDNLIITHPSALCTTIRKAVAACYALAETGTAPTIVLRQAKTRILEAFSDVVQRVRIIERRYTDTTVTEGFSIILGQYTITVSVASLATPFRHGVEPPPALLEGIAISTSAEARQALGWSVEQSQRMERLVAHLIHMGGLTSAPVRAKILYEYLVLAHPPSKDKGLCYLNVKQKGQSTRYLLLSTHSEFWLRQPRSEPLPDALRKQIPLPDGTLREAEITSAMERTNAMFRATDDALLSLKSLCVDLSENVPPPRAPPRPISMTCKQQDCGGKHACKQCGEVTMCRFTTKIKKHPYCNYCWATFSSVPILVIEPPLFYNPPKFTHQGTTDIEDVDELKKALAPARNIDYRYAEVGIPIHLAEPSRENLREEEGKIDTAMAAYLGKNSFEFYRPARTVRYRGPLESRRMYLIDTKIWRSPQTECPRPTRADDEILSEAIARWADTWRDFYSRSGSWLIDSWLESAALLPSLERVLPIDSNGETTHTIANTVVTCRGYNYLHNGYDSAMVILFTILRVLVVIEAALAKDGSQLAQDRLVELRRLRRVIVDLVDQLTVNRTPIPWSTRSRAETSPEEVRRIVRQGADLFCRSMGFEIPWYRRIIDLAPYKVSSVVAPPVLTPGHFVPPAPSSPAADSNPHHQVPAGSRPVKATKRWIEECVDKLRQSFVASRLDETIRTSWNVPQTSYKADWQDLGEDDEEVPGEVDADVLASVDLEVDGVNLGKVNLADIQAALPAILEQARKSKFVKVHGVKVDENIARLIEEGTIFQLVPGTSSLEKQSDCKQELLERLIIVCDRGSWYIIITLETFIVHNVFMRCINGGICHIFGIPMSAPLRAGGLTRDIRHYSEGHLIHGVDMFRGYLPQDWVSLAQNGVNSLLFDAANVFPETWAANLYRWNHPRDDLPPWDRYVLERGLEWLDLVFAGYPLLSTIDDGWLRTTIARYFITDDLSYL